MNENKNEKYEIKPCPFCGHKGYLTRKVVPRRRRELNDYLYRYFVYCKNINCSIKPSTAKNYIDPELAIKAWNQRG